MVFLCLNKMITISVINKSFLLLGRSSLVVINCDVLAFRTELLSHLWWQQVFQSHFKVASRLYHPNDVDFLLQCFASLLKGDLVSVSTAATSEPPVYIVQVILFEVADHRKREI